MQLEIHHKTRFDYQGRVSLGDQSLFLHPRPSHLMRVESFQVHTAPASRQRWVRDAYNNIVLVANFGLQTTTVLEFDCRIGVFNLDSDPFDFVLEPYATKYPFQYTERERTALQPSMVTMVEGAATVADWFGSHAVSSSQATDTVGFLMELNQAVSKEIGYERREEEGIQTPDLTLQRGQGSCRDMALLFVAVCRHLGLATRFVSGYLYEPPEESGGGPGFNRAAGSMHAWAEIYLPGAGWKGFDPTNGVLANAFFIPSAVAIEPASIDPIQGNFYSPEPVGSSMEVSLQISQVEKR